MGFLDCVLVLIVVLALVVAAACVVALNAALVRESGLVLDNERLQREVDGLTADNNVLRRFRRPIHHPIPTQREATS